MIAPIIGNGLSGCSSGSDKTPPPLSVLSGKQNRLIMDITDTLVPKTDTPGATDVGVNLFIDLVLQDVMSEEDANKFLKGLDDFEAKVVSETGKSFSEHSPDEREKLLRASSDTSFYKSVRDLTRTGYNTSEQGIKTNYNYTPIPGKYEGCAEMISDERRARGNHI